MTQIFAHTKLGFCWWDLIALLVLIGVIVYFVVRAKKMKKIQSEYEDCLSGLYAKDTVKSQSKETDA